MIGKAAETGVLRGQVGRLLQHDLRGLALLSLLLLAIVLWTAVHQATSQTALRQMSVQLGCGRLPSPPICTDLAMELGRHGQERAAGLLLVSLFVVAVATAMASRGARTLRLRVRSLLERAERILPPQAVLRESSDPLADLETMDAALQAIEEQQSAQSAAIQK